MTLQSPEQKLRAINTIELPVPDIRPQGSPGTRRLERTSSETILNTVYPPTQWVIPDYLPEGFSVLAGRQKLGKTWLAMEWAISVAIGGIAMGSISCDAGDVLYIDMENGERRIQQRLKMLCPDEHSNRSLDRLQWATDPVQLNDGFIDALDDWRRSVMSPRLVVIDVLQRIKPPGSGSRTAYENDYSIWAPLQAWAVEHGIAVLGLHHTRKGGADDPLEALSGSNGLSAVADTTLVLDRDANGMTLYVRGRDVEEKESAMRFDAGLWTVQGDAHDVRQSSERKAILAELLDADDLMSVADLTAATGKKRGAVDKMLHHMAKADEVIRVKRGRYAHPERKDLWEPHTPGKTGKKVRR